MLILEGIVLGLTLAVLTGPLFVTLVNTSVKRGIKEGLAVGSGIWFSDVLIVAFSLLFVNRLSPYINHESFRFWVGMAGGIILIAIGVFSLTSKVESRGKVYPQYIRYMGYWAKGFAINTFNPFTFVFWIGVMSTYTIGRSIPTSEMVVFLVTILMVIVLTDTLKVLAADKISHYFNSELVNKIQRSAGIILMIFGLVLIFKSL